MRDVSTAFAKVHLHAHLSLITPASDETLQPLVVDQKFAHGADDTLQRAIQVVYQEHKPITSHQLSTTGCVLALLPLKGSTRSRGVLLLSPIDHNDHTLVTQGPLTEALASLIATSLERLHFVEVAHASQLETSAERLRSSILSALSHDIRTPQWCQHPDVGLCTRPSPCQSSTRVTAPIDPHRCSADGESVCKLARKCQQIQPDR